MGGLIHEINVENNTVLGSSVAQFAPKEARLLPETKIKEIGVKDLGFGLGQGSWFRVWGTTIYVNWASAMWVFASALNLPEME